MAWNHKQLALSVTLICVTGINLLFSAGKAAANETGAKGAETYCYMRANGNPHEVSWKASYALMKRQTNSIFKTSPQHAAVMIIEAVVKEPNNYPECGSFLGDLFGGNQKDNINTVTPNTKDSERESRYSF